MRRGRLLTSRGLYSNGDGTVWVERGSRKGKERALENRISDMTAALDKHLGNAALPELSCG